MMVATRPATPATSRTPITTTRTLRARMVRVHSGGRMTASPTDEPVAPERVLSATVEAAERGERLDRFLARRFGDLSRTRLKHLVEAGQGSVGGATIKEPSLRVEPGQRCAGALPAPIADTPAAPA